MIEIWTGNQSQIPQWIVKQWSLIGCDSCSVHNL